MRGSVKAVDGAHYLELGPAWCRDALPASGGTAEVEVEVELVPEGPQLDELEPDLRAALLAEPPARRFFEALATFYRIGYVRWVEGAKRPETRARRIAQTVEALKAGRKQR